ncbi:MAG: indole-3-glycerol phosphate synthase TrpC [Nitrospirota bacterium]|jgi:indole-3-glycerol phosphate synthase
MTTLDEILTAKRAWVADCAARTPLAEYRARCRDSPPCRPFAEALRRPAGAAIRFIAEFKRHSPSRGDIRPGARPAQVARIYHAGGAAAVSVLTDAPFFKGDLAHLEEVREAVPLPVLRKDFLLDPYQVYEARAYGADAVLLIAEALERDELKELHGLTAELGMEALVEIHGEAALDKVAACPVVGINHRDLKTMRVEMDTSAELLSGGLRERLPSGAVVVGESGVSNREQVERMAALGLDALLVGSALMEAPDIATKLGELFPESSRGR